MFTLNCLGYGPGGTQQTGQTRLGHWGERYRRAVNPDCYVTAKSRQIQPTTRAFSPATPLPENQTTANHNPQYPLPLLPEKLTPTVPSPISLDSITNPLLRCTPQLWSCVCASF